jgi:hypothetical protein
MMHATADHDQVITSRANNVHAPVGLVISDLLLSIFYLRQLDLPVRLIMSRMILKPLQVLS